MIYPHVAVIIVNLNGAKMLSNCLDSINKLNYPQSKLHTILVDNGSTDNSLHIIKSFNNIKTIKNNKNLGFSKANNQGIKLALNNQSIKYIWLLNNDTKVEKNYLKNSVKFLEKDKKIAAAVGKILKLKNNELIDSAGDYFHYPSYRFYNRGANKPDKGQFEKTQPCLSACAASAIYRASAIKKAKINSEFLDENFGSYLEDVDLSLRLRLLGYQIYYLPTAIAYHLGSYTSSRIHKNYKEYISRRNRILLVIKNFPLKRALFLLYKYNTPSFIGIKNHVFKQYKRTKSKGIKHYYKNGLSFYILLILNRYRNILILSILQIKAVIACIPLIPKMLKKRKQIQNKRVISNQQINCWLKLYIDYD